MSRLVGVLATLLLTVISPAAWAQAGAAASKPPAELGVGAGALLVCGWAGGFAGGRISLPLSRRVAVEGIVDLDVNAASDLLGFARGQARWRLGPERQGHHWFSTAGVTAAVCCKQQDYSRRDVSVLPMPTAGIGFQKVLGSGIALRTELVAAAVWTDGVFVVWMPSVSVSLPLRRSGGPAR